MNTKLVRFTKYMLDAMFYIGIVLTAAIPVLFYFFGNYIESFRKYYVFQCVIYMASGVMALFIIKELRKMFLTVLTDNPFVMENAGSLKKMGKCSFMIALLSIIPPAGIAHSGDGCHHYRVCHCRTLFHCALPGV